MVIAKLNISFKTMGSFSCCLDEEKQHFNWLSPGQHNDVSRIMALGTGRIIDAKKTITKQSNQKCKDRPITKSVI